MKKPRIRMVRQSPGEWVFDGINAVAMFVVLVCTLYPFLYVAFASVSKPSLFIQNIGLLFYPHGFTLDAYRLVFKNQMLMIGYRNTFFYLVCGLALNMVMTSLCAYALAQKGYYFKKFFTFIILFTMYFGGGLIPFYLLIQDLNMLDRASALIVPTAVNTFNMIVLRTAFANVPASLEESARIDGANDLTILWRVVIPLSMSTMMVIGLYYAVEIWNAWFYASIFITSRELFPLQLVLREILITSDTGFMAEVSVNTTEDVFLSEIIKYATIMVATIPILMVYPFIQKYFVKGVMIGALKE